MNEEIIIRQNDDQIDEVEAFLLSLDHDTGIRIEHTFTEKMYIREMFVPAGRVFTSAKHLTEHPFFLASGTIIISVDNGEAKTYSAPIKGITKIGTRRVAISVTPVHWITFHVNEDNERDVIKLEKRYYAWDNKLITNKLRKKCLLLSQVE